MIPEDELQRNWLIRKVLTPLNPVDAMELLLKNMKGTKNNKELMDRVKGGGYER